MRSPIQGEPRDTTKTRLALGILGHKTSAHCSTVEQEKAKNQISKLLAHCSPRSADTRSPRGSQHPNTGDSHPAVVPHLCPHPKPPRAPRKAAPLPCNFPEATLVSECERTWLFLRMPCGADDCPSEKLDRRNRPRPQLPPPLAPCSPREETESSFWELLEEKRLELLLLLLLVLALLQARPRRPKLPMARYSGPSLGSLCASSWLPVQVSSLWLVVLELISLAGEKGSLGEGMRELGCSREVLSSLKEEERVAGQCSWGWLVLEQTEELAGLLSEGRQEGGITHTAWHKHPPYGTKHVASNRHAHPPRAKARDLHANTGRVLLTQRT